MAFLFNLFLVWEQLMRGAPVHFLVLFWKSTIELASSFPLLLHMHWHGWALPRIPRRRVLSLSQVYPTRRYFPSGVRVLHWYPTRSKSLEREEYLTGTTRPAPGEQISQEVSQRRGTRRSNVASVHREEVLHSAVGVPSRRPVCMRFIGLYQGSWTPPTLNVCQPTRNNESAKTEFSEFSQSYIDFTCYPLRLGGIRYGVARMCAKCFSFGNCRVILAGSESFVVSNYLQRYQAERCGKIKLSFVIFTETSFSCVQALRWMLERDSMIFYISFRY